MVAWWTVRSTAASVMAGSGKIFPHSPEGLVGGDQHGAAFITGADQLEQHASLGLILGDVGNVIEDQEM
jgi:hypothetical protein